MFIWEKNGIDKLIVEYLKYGTFTNKNIVHTYLNYRYLWLPTSTHGHNCTPATSFL